jgi:hypothetical protein
LPGEEATPWVGWWSRFTLRERASGVAAGRWVEPRVWLWIFAVGVIGMFRERGRRGFGEAERGIEGWFGREGRPCGHGLVPHEGIRGDFAIVEHFLERCWFLRTKTSMMRGGTDGGGAVQSEIGFCGRADNLRWPERVG